MSEPHFPADFGSTNRVLEILSHLSFSIGHHVPGLEEVQRLLPEEEEKVLLRLTEADTLSATVLPIRSVGVQVGVVRFREGGNSSILIHFSP